MRRALFLALLLGAVALGARPAARASDDPRLLARREAWGSAVLVASILERGENNASPGLRAWLADFRRVEAKLSATETPTHFAMLDSRALVLQNPRFWTAAYEIAPGDPGWCLLHAALLLCGGEAQRATVIATLGLQRPDLAPEFRRRLEGVIAGAQAAQAGSQALVRQGVRLHDAGAFDAALRQYAAALAEWPANGQAYYERASTLRLAAIATAPRLAANSDGAEEPVNDPPGTREAFAAAREHDPLCVMAYQGEDPAAAASLLTLVRTALPIWEEMRRRPGAATREQLRDFSSSCRDAGIDEYALVARQQFVARNRSYQGDDIELITTCVSRLAPQAEAALTLTRVASDPRSARQIAAPEPAGEPALAEIGGEALILAALQVERDRLAKAAAPEKAKTSAKTSGKAKSRSTAKSSSKKRKRR